MSVRQPATTSTQKRVIPATMAKALSTCRASIQSSKLTPFNPTKSTSFLLGLHWDGGKNHLGGGIVVWIWRSG